MFKKNHDFTNKNAILTHRKVVLLLVKCALVWLAIFFQFKSVAQDILYVWAKHGLTLRDAPSKKGNKIKVLPYGTKVEWLEVYRADSILIIPSLVLTDNTLAEAFFLSGNWRKVKVGEETGYLFDGYLSEMQPFKSKHKNNYYGNVDEWILQQASVRDTIRSKNDPDDYTVAYSNHVVKSVNVGQGGGSSKFIFPSGRTFNDGFLLLNYFEDFNFTKKELDAAFIRSFTTETDYLLFESEGFKDLFWMFSIRFDDGLLIIETGAGC